MNGRNVSRAGDAQIAANGIARRLRPGLVRVPVFVLVLSLLSAPAATAAIVQGAPPSALTPSPAATPGSSPASSGSARSVGPALVGTARDGQALSVALSSDVATYRWERCAEPGVACAEIRGATAASYTPGPLDVGFVLRAVVTRKGAAGTTADVSSLVSERIVAAPPAQAERPRVFGRAELGAELTAVADLWFGTPPFSLSYQWLRCTGSGSACVAVPGETAKTYRSTVADAGSLLAVEVTASNAAGSASARSLSFNALSGGLVGSAVDSPRTDKPSAGQEGQRSSGTTAADCYQNPVNYDPPQVSPSGSIVAGGQIEITWWGLWDPGYGCPGEQFRFAWFRSGGLVYDAGLSSGPYGTGSADIGHVIEMQVTFEYTTDTYHGASARAAGVAVTAPPPPPNDPPYFVEPIGPVGGTTPPNGPVFAQYNDPNGDHGTVTVRVYNAGTSTLVSESSVTNVGPNTAPNIYVNNMGTGQKTVVITAVDNRGAPASNYVQFDLWSTNPPTVPSLISPLGTTGSPSLMTSPTAVLKASATDADSNWVGMNFKVTSVPDCANASGGQIVKESPLLGTWPTAGGNVATWKVPEGVLKDNTTYYWCAISMDPTINYGYPNSGWSAARAFTVRIPGFGVRSSWPMWQRGPLAVNQATGNLVVAMPGPSYPTAIGELSVSVAYNSLDGRGNMFGLGNKWILGTVGSVPAKLFDHNLFGGVNEVYDGIERVNADGSSDYYAHVGGATSGAYVSQTGDRSLLSRNADGTWTLADPDGSVYTFAGTAAADFSYRLLSAEVAVGKSSAASFVYTPDAQGRIDLIEAKVGSTTVSSLDFNWACAGALMCVSGPDARTWKYIGDSGGGATGRLETVRLEWAGGAQGRNLARVGYTGADFVSAYVSANDIADSVPGWRVDHQVLITYNGTKVQDVTDGPIRRDLAAAAGTDLNPKWTFTYTPGNVPTTATATAHNGTAAGVQRTAAGFTELCPPRQQPGCVLKARVYYDALWQTLEARDVATPTGVTKSQFDVSGRLLWSEDELGKPTDVTIDELTGLVTQSQAPDADGPGPLGRITTAYRYDETKIGTATANGPLLTGLQAAYYNGQNMTGRPVTVRTDAGVDFGSWTGSPAAGVNADGFSVRWRGIVNIPAAGDYRFSTVATGGTRLYVDGMQLIDKWGSQAGETCSGEAPLTAGRHMILLEYKDSGSGTASVQLRRTGAGGSCADGGAADGSVIAASDLAPNYGNRTSTITPKNTDAGPDLVTFSHFKEPWLGQPDYTLVRDAAGQDLVTSFEYDSLGRVASKVLPKGNQGRTIDANGDLPTSPIDTLYQTTWTYYGASEQAAQDTQCGAGSQISQQGLSKQLSSPGLAPVTTVYDAGGRPLSVDSGTRVVCRVYTGDGRLEQEKAKKDSEGVLTTTAYTYDPDGNPLSVSEGGAPEAVTTVYNEAGWVLETEDATAATGAKARQTYDLEGNVTQRVVQLPNAGASYTSTYAYDAKNRVTSQTDPAGRTYGFWYDSRGFLYAINYPNNTFLWRNASDGGLVTAVHARNGQVTTPGVEPSGSAIIEYSYSYFQNGQRKSEDRSGNVNGSPLGTTGLTSYAYDPVGRLEQVTFPGSIGSRRYCFDRDSNRTGFTASASTPCTTPLASYAYSSTAMDRLDSVTQGTTTAYSYDADGNVTGRGATTLNWDRYGRHSGATVGSPNALSDVQFTVDGAPSGSPVTGTSPFQKNVDTAGLSNGWHTIGATANTTNGKQGAAPTRVIRVQNGAGPDTTAPTVSITAPAGGASVSGTVAVNATASDNVGVTAVQFRRDGVDLGADTSAPYTVNWNTTTTPNGSHALTAVALDAAGNAAGSSQVTVTVANSSTVPGLVAAYAFEELSGTSSADSSGTGNTGTISGATPTTAGKNGNALEYDGVNDVVNVPDAASLDLGTTGTIMGWARLDATNRWHGLIAKGSANSPTWHNYALLVTNSNRARCEISPSNGTGSASATQVVPLGMPGLIANQWYHLACAWTATTLRLYIGGNLNGQVTHSVTPVGNSSQLTIGRYGGTFDPTDGRIDDVRVYNRTLSQAEIQADMNTAVGAGSGDTTPPTASITAPTGGAAVSGTVAVNATASDNVGVSAVQFRRDGVDLGSDTTSPYSVNWDTSTTPNGSHILTAVALDAAGNATTSSQVSVTVGENTPPTTPGTPSVTVTPGKAQLTWAASTDGSGVAYYRVHRSTTTGFTPGSGNEVAQTTLTSYTDNGDGTTNGLPAGTYYYKVVALDVNANVSSASAQGSGVVTADTSLPMAAFTAPTPASTSTVNGTITLAATASSPAGGGSTLSYGFDPTGFRSTRTLNGITTRYLLGGLIETNSAGAITLFDVDGPMGDLAHYTAAPTSGQTNVSFHYYNAHGDLAAEASVSGIRTAAHTSDPFGAPLEATPADTTVERWTGQWDKKLDTTTGLIEMGARPYDPVLGRFLAVDPVEGGSCNAYDYACQDAVNVYDLDGRALFIPVVIIVSRVAPIAAPVVIRVITRIASPTSQAAGRSAAVKDAWALERQLVIKTGQGTRDWTAKEMAQLVQNGRVIDYIGHHINSVKAAPWLARDPRNISFVLRVDHLGAHGGNWRNVTYGALIRR